MVSVTVSPAGKSISIARGLPSKFNIHVQDATIRDVKAAIATKFPRFYPARQKITVKDNKKTLTDDLKLVDASITDGSELLVKDLGPQVDWKTVFLVEYSGPLVIQPIFYHFGEYIWGGPVPHSMLQRFAYTFIMLHFGKRILETLFVHRFSHATMPWRNLIKNSLHYHVLSGLLLAVELYSPRYSAMSPYIRGTVRDNPTFIWACTAVWVFAEISNLITHLKLRDLRPAGSRQRAIPYGYGFSLVSFPNYFFESLAWFIVAYMTGSIIAYVFLVVATVQMYIWAKKKHAGYRKEFGSAYPKERKAMFPFLA